MSIQCVHLTEISIFFLHASAFDSTNSSMLAALQQGDTVCAVVDGISSLGSIVECRGEVFIGLEEEMAHEIHRVKLMSYLFHSSFLLRFIKIY